jgi:hypothetical protein
VAQPPIEQTIPSPHDTPSGPLLQPVGSAGDEHTRQESAGLVSLSRKTSLPILHPWMHVPPEQYIPLPGQPVPSAAVVQPAGFVAGSQLWHMLVGFSRPAGYSWPPITQPAKVVVVEVLDEVVVEEDVLLDSEELASLLLFPV